MTDADDHHEAPLPEKRRSRQRAPGAVKGLRTVSGSRRSKMPGKAKSGRSPVLAAVLSFPGRVIATATMCVVLIALAQFVWHWVRR